MFGLKLRKKQPEKNIQEIHEYWRNPPESQDPKRYANLSKGENRNEVLLNLIHKTNLPKNSKILELGCNIGRNLNLLFENGYENLHAVEINPKAIDKMKEVYPQIIESVTVENNSIEESLTKNPDGEYDLVFTMAVLEHIHTDSNWIFQEIERISKKYVITIEDEKSISERHFPRNYKKIFEKLGMKEILEVDCKEVVHWQGKFRGRVFRKIRT